MHTRVLAPRLHLHLHCATCTLHLHLATLLLAACCLLVIWRWCWRIGRTSCHVPGEPPPPPKQQPALPCGVSPTWVIPAFSLKNKKQHATAHNKPRPSTMRNNTKPRVAHAAKLQGWFVSHAHAVRWWLPLLLLALLLLALLWLERKGWLL
jgi:hypothetical protein